VRSTDFPHHDRHNPTPIEVVDMEGNRVDV
jgi:hypothetical protein